jgi:hypothetical protein
MNWLLNALAIIGLVLLALAGLFIFSAAVTAIWRSLHEQELVRLRKFRDEIIIESGVAESISAETVARIAHRHEVAS